MAVVAMEEMVVVAMVEVMAVMALQPHFEYPMKQYLVILLMMY